MKILQLIQKQQLRGAEIFASQLSTHLENAGHQVMIVSLGGGDAVLPFSGKIISLHANFKRKFLDWKAWKKLAVIIKEFQPDIVQANAGDTLKYAVFSKKLFHWKQPVIFRNASMVSNYVKAPHTKLLTSFLFKNVSRFISVSDYTRKDLAEHFDIPLEKIVVLPVGIESKEFKRLDAFDQSLFNLVHIGGFSFEKNHDRLLYMFKELLNKDRKFRLWLVGDGPLMNKTKALAKELQLEDYVFFEGFQKNPLDYIASSAMLLLPSKIEGLPAVILEAFYCRIPVVANNVGGISELVINKETGWLVGLDDEAGFVEAVMEVAHATREKIQPVLDRAYQKVTAAYFNNQIAGSFAKTYQSLVSRN